MALESQRGLLRRAPRGPSPSPSRLGAAREAVPEAADASGFLRGPHLQLGGGSCRAPRRAALMCSVPQAEERALVEAESRVRLAELEAARRERSRRDARELEDVRREAMAGVWGGAEPAVRRAAEEQSRQRLAEADARRREVAALGEAEAQRRAEEAARRDAVQEAGRLLAAAQARKDAEALVQATARAHAEQASEWAAARAALARMQMEAREPARNGAPVQTGRYGREGAAGNGWDAAPPLRQDSPGRGVQQAPSPPIEEYAAAVAAAPVPPPRRRPEGGLPVSAGGGGSASPPRTPQTLPQPRAQAAEGVGQARAESVAGAYSAGGGGGGHGGSVPGGLGPGSPGSPGLERNTVHSQRLALEKARMEALEAAKRKAEEAAQRVAELQMLRRQLPGTPGATRQRSSQSTGPSPATSAEGASRGNLEAAALQAVAMMDGPLLSAPRDKLGYSFSPGRESLENSTMGQKSPEGDWAKNPSYNVDGRARNGGFKEEGPRTASTRTSDRLDSPFEQGSGFAAPGNAYSPAAQDERRNLFTPGRGLQREDAAMQKMRVESEDLAAAINQGRRPPAALDPHVLDRMDIIEAQESNAARNAISWQRKARLFGTPASLLSQPSTGQVTYLEKLL